MSLSRFKMAGYDQHHSESRAAIGNGSYLQGKQLFCLPADGIWQELEPFGFQTLTSAVTFVLWRQTDASVSRFCKSSYE